MTKYSSRHVVITLALSLSLLASAGGCSVTSDGSGRDAPPSRPDDSSAERLVTVAPSTPEDAPSAEPPLTAEPDPSELEAAAPARSDVWDRDGYLEMMARHIGISDPPEVELIREVHADEQGAALAACVSEYGLASRATGDGGFTTEYMTEQEETFKEAWYICEAKYTLMPEFYRPYDDLTLERIHDYLFTEVATCFVIEGYPIDIPTLESFKAQYALDRSVVRAFLVAPTSLWEACHINIPNDVIYPR